MRLTSREEKDKKSSWLRVRVRYSGTSELPIRTSRQERRDYFKSSDVCAYDLRWLAFIIPMIHTPP
eukprot:scaffold8211_cov659-Pinguiococcus_pyrenoidosus.AAC.1